jgi:hypothetical protein
MIRGNIAISDKDPKTWRSRGRKRKQPALTSAIVTPALMKKRLKGPVIRLNEPHQDIEQEQPRRSAIVEPKRRPNNAMLHLLEEVTDEERNRRADLADEMFREIKRRIAAVKRD